MSMPEHPLQHALPEQLGAVADVAGIVGDDGPGWLLLGEDGRLTRWYPERGADVETAETIAAVPPEPDRGDQDQSPYQDRVRHRLHVSQCGRFAAVVEDHGNRGVVLDLATGTVTMRLDGGDYHEDVVPFSLLFAEHEGAPVVVHRTAWNRLDVSDPATGRLLTTRDLPDSAVPGDETHFLDYFHGALYLSPDGTRIYDDGWVWQPLGVPVVWSLPAWLRDDPFESEDGASRIEYAFLDEWDRGVAWIRPDRIAVYDAGDNDGQAPCVRVLDPTRPGSSPAVTSEVMMTVTTFPGPDGRYFTDGARLFIANEAGLEAWDVDAGEKVFAVPDFRPVRQHPHTLELIELGSRVVRCWQPRADPHGKT